MVTSDNLKQLVLDVVERKKKFYRMKIHHIKIEARQNETQIMDTVEAAKREMYCKMKEARRQLKMVSVSFVNEPSQSCLMH